MLPAGRHRAELRRVNAGSDWLSVPVSAAAHSPSNAHLCLAPRTGVLVLERLVPFIVRLRGMR
jgi:hypothetical protein